MYRACFRHDAIAHFTDYGRVHTVTCAGKPVIPETHCVELTLQYLWGIGLYFAFWDTRLPPTIPARKGRGVLLKWEAFYIPLAVVLALKGCARRSEMWKKNAPDYTPWGNWSICIPCRIHNQGDLAPSIPSDIMLLTTWINEGFLQPEISNPVEHWEDCEILIRPQSSSPETSLWRPRTERKPLAPQVDVGTFLGNSTKVQPMANNQHHKLTCLNPSEKLFL